MDFDGTVGTLLLGMSWEWIAFGKHTRKIKKAMGKPKKFLRKMISTWLFHIYVGFPLGNALGFNGHFTRGETKHLRPVRPPLTAGLIWVHNLTGGPHLV
jgi:hypothetical protein